MSTTYGHHGPSYPRLAALTRSVAQPAFERAFALAGLHREDSDYARSQAADLRARAAAGERVLLLGILPAFHNTGVALVEVTPEGELRLLCNEEEERYSGVKFANDYPEFAVEALLERLREHDARPEDIHTCVCAWDYATFAAHGLESSFGEFPGPLVKPPEELLPRRFAMALSAPWRLGRALGLGRRMPIVLMRHHDSHAYCSYLISPFAGGDETTMITVIDGWGDDHAVSLYRARGTDVELVRDNGSIIESLGALYAIFSSTQGGWAPLQATGRYMGAAAWGDGDRLTNPYYKRLRQVVYFGPRGEVKLNRGFARWPKRGQQNPYEPELVDILGPPIPPEKMWDPDAILNVDDVEHAEITRERVDKAAAVQMVFEDALFHVVDWFVRETGSTQLVMTGGTALNCVANRRVLDRYDEAWYARNLGRKGRLHLWVPPMQGDPGTVPGGPYAFAWKAGVRRAERLRHAFYCGRGPTLTEVRTAVAAAGDVELEELGDVASEADRDAVADYMASVVARDGVLGLHQGAAETGPRALGHRSILANPCNPNTLETLNARVKYRERIRPLAPIATLAAAHELFELSPGGSDDDYNAYNYMVLTAVATPLARERVPAVVHRDGTARVQVCRPDDPLTYAFLLAMGRHAGVEVAVNTSLNVGSPIVQTPEQAIGALRKAKAMDGIVFVAEGVVLLARPVRPHEPSVDGDGASRARAGERFRAAGPRPPAGSPA